MLTLEARLNRHEWCVKPTPLAEGRRLVEAFHYARGGANTATYMLGLFRIDTPEVCCGVTWWIPPTKSAALATFPENWLGVLALSRLVVVPGVPPNACTFLLSRSRKLIDRVRWPCLVTYADTWRGHTGAIYKADNWEYLGMTKPEECFVLNGRMVARKAGPKTRTRGEMAALGAESVGKFAKHKYRHLLT